MFVVPKANERPVIQIADDETNLLHASWSRSGKRLIVSVAPRGDWHRAGQVELTADQVEALRTFLSNRAE